MQSLPKILLSAICLLSFPSTSPHIKALKIGVITEKPNKELGHIDIFASMQEILASLNEIYKINNTELIFSEINSGSKRYGAFQAVHDLLSDNFNKTSKEYEIDAVVGPVTSVQTYFSYIMIDSIAQGAEDFERQNDGLDDHDGLLKDARPYLKGDKYLPLISPTATDTELSNMKYYINLWKISPPDKFMALTISKLLDYLEIEQIVVLASKNDHGQHFMTEIDILENDEKSYWEVGQHFFIYDEVSENNSIEDISFSINETLLQIQEEGYRVILLILDQSSTNMVLKQAEKMSMTEKGYLYILIDSGTSNLLPDDRDMLKKISKRIIGIIPDPECAREFYRKRKRRRRDLFDDDEFFNQKEINDNNVWSDNIDSDLNSIRNLRSHLNDGPIVKKFAEALIILYQCSKYEDKCAKDPSKTLPDRFMYECLRNTKYFQDDQYSKFIGYSIQTFKNNNWFTHANYREVDRNIQILNDFPNEVYETSENSRVIDHENKVYQIGVVCDPPFIICERDMSRVSGFAIDIIEMIQKELKFQYKTQIFNTYGQRNSSTNEWSGLIKGLATKDIDQKIDIALAPAISIDRIEVAEFSEIISESPIGYITMKSHIEKISSRMKEKKSKNDKEKSEKFDYTAFLKPLSNDLWGYILLSAICVACVTSLLDKLSPYGYHGSYFQSSQPETLYKMRSGVLTQDNIDTKILEQDLETAKRTFNLNNAIFWSFSSLFWQSPDKVPRCYSSRIMGCAWAGASVIFICSYTANLIAFVAAENTSQLRNLEKFQKIYNRDDSVDGSFLLDDLSNDDFDFTTISNSQIEAILDKVIDPNIAPFWEKAQEARVEKAKSRESVLSSDGDDHFDDEQDNIDIDVTDNNNRENLQSELEIDKNSDLISDEQYSNLNPSGNMDAIDGIGNLDWSKLNSFIDKLPLDYIKSAIHITNQPTKVNSVKEGILRALQKSQVFFWESTSLRYQISQFKILNTESCKMASEARVLNLDSPGLIKRAIAFRKHSPLKETFNEVLENIIDSVEFKATTDKWLKVVFAIDEDRCDDDRVSRNSNGRIGFGFWEVFEFAKSKHAFD